MTNPFEDDEAQYLVLVNNETQYSIWPASTAIPEGWNSVRPPDTRQSCLDYVENAWTDMRPRTLRSAQN